MPYSVKTRKMRTFKKRQFNSGIRCCEACGRPMFYYRLETWDDYATTHLELTREPPDTWETEKFLASVDHIIPVSKGGSDSQFNFTMLCAGCNNEKASRTLSEWIEWLLMEDRPLPSEAVARLLRAEARALDYHENRKPQMKGKIMADENTETPTPDGTRKREVKSVERLDYTLPIFVLIHQTETRTVTEIVKGNKSDKDHGLAKAQEQARETSARLGRTVAVFGPQTAAYAPPPKVEPEQVGFSF